MQSWQLRQSKYAHIVIDASPIWSHVTIIFGLAGDQLIQISTGISTLSANPLLSIADTSLSQCLSSNNNESYYPSKIIGFIEVGDKQEAAIQCSEKPLEWKTVETKFFIAITIGTDSDISFVTVPIDALVHPLCVLPDIGGNTNSYFVILPRRNWSRYFGDKIRYDEM